jgi:hypothetical protein
MTSFGRGNPNPEYLGMVAMDQRLHEEGEAAAGKSGTQTFPGKMLTRHAPGIKEMIERSGAADILEYGAGKGVGYELRDVALSKDKVVLNGQHMHCTVKSPEWWAGLFHGIALRYTEVSYRLITSTATGCKKKFGFAKTARKNNRQSSGWPDPRPRLQSLTCSE